MNRFIVLVDDAPHCLSSPLGAPIWAALGSECVLLACAPRMTHRVSKWVSHSSREHWRDKWATKLFDQLVPALLERGQRLRTELVRGPVQDHIDAVLREGPAQVIDLRRPRRAEGDHSTFAGWMAPMLAGFGTWLALLAE